MPGYGVFLPFHSIELQGENSISAKTVFPICGNTFGLSKDTGISQVFPYHPDAQKRSGPMNSPIGFNINDTYNSTTAFRGYFYGSRTSSRRSSSKTCTEYRCSYLETDNDNQKQFLPSLHTMQFRLLVSNRNNRR